MDFWNDFFAPFIYLNNVDKDTIVLRLFRIWSDAEGYMREELHTVMAGNVLVHPARVHHLLHRPETLHPGHRHHRHQGLTTPRVTGVAGRVAQMLLARYAWSFRWTPTLTTVQSLYDSCHDRRTDAVTQNHYPIATGPSL